MNRLWGLRLALAVCLGGTMGCMGTRPEVAAVTPDLLDLIKKQGEGQPVSITRAQQPDISPSGGKGFNPPTPVIKDSDVAGATAASVWVTVNGTPILFEEVEAACKGMLKSLDSYPEAVRVRKRTEIITATTNQIIDRELVLQDMHEKLSQNKGTKKFLEAIQKEATANFERTVVRSIRESQQIESDEKLREFFTANGFSYDMVRRQNERQFMYTEYIKARLKSLLDRIGHQEIQEYYDGHPEEFKAEDSVEWQDICISTTKNYSRDAALRLAESLSQRVRNGENFVQLCEQFDDGFAKTRENCLGEGMKRGTIRPQEVEDALFRLADGQVGPVIEIPSGFHVVKVLKRTYAGQMKFDDKVQKEIRIRLRNEILQREMKDYVKKLRDKATVEWSTASR